MSKNSCMILDHEMAYIIQEPNPRNAIFMW